MATSVVHFYDELTQYLEDTIEMRFRELMFDNGVLVPTTTNLEPGVREVAEDVMTGVGEASLLAPGAGDIPIVQISMTQDRYPVVMAASAYAVEFQEERAFRRTGKNVREGRATFVRRAISERLNRFTAYGDPGINARGLVNNANVTVDNNSFNPNTADFATFVNFLIDVVLRLGLDSDEITFSTDVLMSPRMHNKAQQVTSPDNPEVSVMQAVRNRLRDEEGVAEVRFVKVPEVSSAKLEKYGVMAGGTNKDRLVVYNKDPMYVNRQIESVAPQMFPEEYIRSEGVMRYFPMFSCATATKVRELPSIRYIDTTRAT